MKIYILSIFLLTTLVTSAQRYKAVYNETMQFSLPDSGMKEFRAQMVAKGFPEATADQLVAQMAVSMSQRKLMRTVDAAADSTFILITAVSDSGDMKFNMPNQRMLVTNDKVYAYANGAWSDAGKGRSKRDFKPTGKTKKILDWECQEYLTVDSTCVIWITDKLPSFINPGVRVDGIKGGVLAAEIKEKGSPPRRIEISKLDR